jgi:bacterioferritin-associated ferredoxin
VAYFDAWGTQAPAGALRRPAYPKSPAAPLCSCFGITAAQIRDEAEAGRKDLIRKLIERAASDEARCETEAPCGSSCVVEARRIFLKHFAGDGRG